MRGEDRLFDALSTMLLSKRHPDKALAPWRARDGGSSAAHSYSFHVASLPVRLKRHVGLIYQAVARRPPFLKGG